MKKEVNYEDLQRKDGRKALLIGAALTVILSLTAASFVVLNTGATHSPADKIGVSASTLEVMEAVACPVVPCATSSSREVTLLTAAIHTSAPTDLMLRVTAECAVWTSITGTGTTDSQAKANVKVWIEIDGNPVPVTLLTPDNGKVVFCNRDFEIDLTGFLPQQMIELFQSTRSANGFNWMTLNVGSGHHTIVVKAQLDVQVTGIGEARAGVGKRTLFVEPAKLANDATF